MKKSAWESLQEAQFGLGKSGDPKHPGDPEELPTQGPMRGSRAQAYDRAKPDSNPKFSRRAHSVGMPVEEDDDDRPNPVKGGVGDKVPFSAVPSDQLGKGVEDEEEHTGNKWVAADIAMDHLAQDPGYYDHEDKAPEAGTTLTFSVRPKDEASSCASMGPQPAGPSLSPEDAVRALVRKKVKEVVRKKKGGGGYVLYSPNMGKKRPPKAVGEFPTRAQAKKAEMLRFPPKDPKKRKALKKSVDRLKAKRESVGVDSYLEELRDRLAEAAEDAMDQDPEKDTATPDEPTGASPEDAAADMAPDASADPSMDAPEPTPPVEPSARPATAPQEESPWDEMLSRLSDIAVKKDPKLRKLVKKVNDATERALEKSVKTLGRLVGGVKTGKVGKDRVGRPYITATIELKSGEVGPVFIYVKGETLHVVSDGKVKSEIMKLEPDEAHEVKQALKDLPDKFDARDLEKAVSLRDKYLEEMELDLDDYLSNLDALELSMLKRLVADKYSGDEDPIE